MAFTKGWATFVHLKACQLTVSQRSQATGSVLDFFFVHLFYFVLFFFVFFQVPLLNGIKIFHEDSVDELLYKRNENSMAGLPKVGIKSGEAPAV